jgi:hypothetical protein
VWVVGGVADNGGCVPCGLAFSKQWNVCTCCSAYFVSRLDSRIYGIYIYIYRICSNLVYIYPSRRCLHFEVVGGLEWSNDPKSYAGGSVATGRASHARKVKGDDPG